jgi:class 3 adenylate cyclase/tetratricopeptide (TPR) repeat protein
MTFEEMLAQVLELLPREKRVSYRALKLRFAINDDYIEGLKDELIYAKKLAGDEENRVLVWTGDTTTGRAGAPQPAQPTPPPAIQAPSPPDERPSAAPRPREAERRQLTVMFCDLVESTQLSGQLDPEVYREVVRAYQSACSEVITRFDGHIAQLLGDGLLVYFGYPHAHEDDAQRAVRTGLGIIEAVGALNTRLEQDKGIGLAVRLGIHTGLVVVGEMGSQGRQEQLALGQVPNVCSRIQGLAAPNTIAMSEATYRLVQGYFACQDLGAQTLRGVTESMRLYQVLGESGATSRLDVAQPGGLTPLVGRESEVTLLLERWAQARAGHGQVVLLTGDAGIGKSRLVQVLKEHAANEPHVRWECRSLSYFENTALYPVTDLFQRLFQFHAEESPNEKFEKLEQALSQYRLPLEESVPLFVPLLSLSPPESRYAPLSVSPQRQRQKTLETIVAILLELAGQQPVLFIIEDLHWTDPTTLELLNLLIDQTPTASVLVLLTCRPYFQPSWHHHSYITEMTVNRLAQPQIVPMVERIADGKILPPEVLQQIIVKADGVPLFVEEMTKAVLESGHLQEIDGQYELRGSLTSFAIPATLQDSLMARLDRLMTAKVIAQLGATIGRQFSYALLQAVAQLDEVMLQHELSRLVEAEIVYQRSVPPQATYVFKHALIQDAAYESLLKSTRQQYHQRIALVLETQFPEVAEAQPELLAHHYTEAGLSEQAIGYWQRAGERSNARSAYVEAVSHLTKGLELLKTLPQISERARQELDMQIILGQALMATKGFGAPEVEQSYTRARALCPQVEDTPQLFSVLIGLWRFYQSRGQLPTIRELGEQCLTLAQRLQDPTLLLWGHGVLGITLWQLGEFAPATAHLAQGIALYDAQQHYPLYVGTDPGVLLFSYAAITLWPLGYPDQALQRSRESLTLAHQRSHAFSLVQALNYAALLHQYRREVDAARTHAEAALDLSHAQGFTQRLAVGMIHRGWALAMQGQGDEGIAEIQQGISAWQATGAEIALPYYLTMLAISFASYAARGSAYSGSSSFSASSGVNRGMGKMPAS